MEIIKIGKFDDRGMPTGWELDGSGMPENGYVLGLDVFFPGSVDVNGVEIKEWAIARKESYDT